MKWNGPGAVPGRGRDGAYPPNDFRMRMLPAGVLTSTLGQNASNAPRSLILRLRASLAAFKPLADRDWDWPTALDRPALERILTLDFLDRGENVVMLGAQGLGENHAGEEHRPPGRPRRTLRTLHHRRRPAARPQRQETARALERRLRHYTRPAILCVDELGYLAYDARAADLIFQLVSRRYEHRSLLITTNLPFKNWDTVFPNASCAVALIDRLTHHVEILRIEGRSYRRREAELSQQERNRQRPAHDEATE